MVRSWVLRKWESAMVREKKRRSFTPPNVTHSRVSKRKFGDILAPPQVIPAINAFNPKPNHLLNKLDTTLDSPVFPPKTNNFQKLVIFVSERSEKVGEKPKPVEKPQPSAKPKPRPKLILFHCNFCRKDGHKEEFCFRRRRDERFARDMANKGRYHPSRGVPEPCVVPLTRGEWFVRIVSTRGGGVPPQRGRRAEFVGCALLVVGTGLGVMIAEQSCVALTTAYSWPFRR
jgi:hypothetical protein